MGEKRVRGCVLIGYLKFIKKEWGEAGSIQVSGEVNFDLEQLRESSWYDISYSSGILNWIATKKGKEFVEKCGSATVKDLGMLSYIVAFSTVKSILAKAPANYADAFGYGRMEVDIEDRRAVVRMVDTAEHELSCLTWLGAFKGIMEKTKTKGSVTETQCQLKGSPHCEYVLEW
jgi:predicted hydrocarbon binding protein